MALGIDVEFYFPLRNTLSLILSYIILLLGARKWWIEEESRLGALTQLCDP